MRCSQSAVIPAPSSPSAAAPNISAIPAQAIAHRCRLDFLRHPGESRDPALHRSPAKSRLLSCFAARQGKGERRMVRLFFRRTGAEKGKGQQAKGKSDAQKKRAAFATRFLHWMVGWRLSNNRPRRPVCAELGSRSRVNAPNHAPKTLVTAPGKFSPRTNSPSCFGLKYTIRHSREPFMSIMMKP